MRDGVGVGDAAHADDVQVIRRVVQRSVQRPIVSYRANHDDSRRRDLVDLVRERAVQVIRPADGKI